MDFKLCTACAAALLALPPAFAQQAPDRSQPLSRAEVRADFQLWKEAGLLELQRGDLGPDVFLSMQYGQALQAYVAARASPRYEELVRELRRNPG